MNLGRSVLACAIAGSALVPGTASAMPLAAPDEAAVPPVEDPGARADERFVWPVVSRSITTQFGGGHAGIDIDGESGDRIVAARSGVVTFAGDDGDGYGLKVLVRHPGGLATLYSHLATIAVKGGPIARGDLVGTVGCTGSCSGDHLHFEIQRNDAPNNPLDFLP